MAGLRTNRFRLLRQDDTARDARLTLSEERLRAARQQEAVAQLGQQALGGDSAGDDDAHSGHINR